VWRFVRAGSEDDDRSPSRGKREKGFERFVKRGSYWVSQRKREGRASTPIDPIRERKRKARSTTEKRLNRGLPLPKKGTETSREKKEKENQDYQRNLLIYRVDKTQNFIILKTIYSRRGK